MAERRKIVNQLKGICATLNITDCELDLINISNDDQSNVKSNDKKRARTPSPVICTEGSSGDEDHGPRKKKPHKNRPVHDISPSGSDVDAELSLHEEGEIDDSDKKSDGNESMIGEEEDENDFLEKIGAPATPEKSQNDDTEQMPKPHCSKDTIQGDVEPGEIAEDVEIDIESIDPFASEKDYEEDEKLGPDVSEEFANIVNARFSKEQSKKSLKKRMDDIARPKNCTGLKVPKVNKMIMKKLNNFKKTEDNKFADVQKAVVKSAQAVTGVMHDLVGPKVIGSKDRNRLLLNAVSLLGAASYDLALMRRDNLKSYSGVLYRHVKDTEVIPIDENLFSSDIGAASERAKRLNRIHSQDLKSKIQNNNRGGHAHSARAGRGGFGNHVSNHGHVRTQPGSGNGVAFLGRGQGHSRSPNMKKKVSFPFNKKM